jgi:hypothetical protein
MLALPLFCCCWPPHLQLYLFLSVPQASAKVIPPSVAFSGLHDLGSLPQQEYVCFDDLLLLAISTDAQHIHEHRHATAERRFKELVVVFCFKFFLTYIQLVPLGLGIYHTCIQWIATHLSNLKEDENWFRHDAKVQTVNKIESKTIGKSSNNREQLIT